MFIIGERINGMFRSVARAIRDRDAAAIVELAQRQIAAGAHALDLNTGPTADDPADVMAWLVNVVQEATPVPLSIDSGRPHVIEAGLRACKGRAIINSTTGARAKLDALLPLAAQYGAGLIALTNDERGIPRNAAARAEIALTIVAAAMEAGVTPDQLYLDPIVLPVNAAQDQTKEALDAIGTFRTLCDPPPHIIIGLSNVSQGAANRPLVNRTYLTMAMTMGCDAAILDPNDKDLMDALRTADILLNREIYAEGYLQSKTA